MSQENVDCFRRTAAAYARRDVEGVIAELDPEVEWRPAFMASLEGDTVYRGHEGVREMLRDVFETMARVELEFPEIRDLGTRVIGIGRARMSGRDSGAMTETPLVTVAEYRNGVGIRLQTFLDVAAGLEAAGLSE